MAKMTKKEYNDRMADIVLFIGQYVLMGVDCKDVRIKALKKKAEKLYKEYWSDDNNEVRNY